MFFVKDVCREIGKARLKKQANAYRYGFNGEEKDDEIAGSGNHYTTEWRELDPRIGGRWWSPDPIVKPWESPYAGFANNPIFFSDPEGLNPDPPKGGGGNPPEQIYDGGGLEEVVITAEKPSKTESGIKGQGPLAYNMQRDAGKRLNYYKPLAEEFANLHKQGKISDATFSTLRYQAQKATKMQQSNLGQILGETAPLGKPLSEQKQLAEAIASGEKQLSKNAYNTRGLTTKVATATQVAGKTLLVVAAGMSIHHVVTADNQARAFSQEAGGWAGAWAGGEAGVVIGASIGSIFPGPGTAIGAFVGGVVGGGVGYFYGSQAGDTAYQLGTKDY